MFEYLSVDNDSLQTDNRDTEYDNQRREESNRRGFSSTEDILMHINEDVIDLNENEPRTFAKQPYITLLFKLDTLPKFLSVHRERMR